MYVGAVAVLFLFVLMMLNVKMAELLKTHKNSMPICFIFGFVLLYQFMFLLRFEFEILDSLDVLSVAFLYDLSCLYTFEFLHLNFTLTNIKLVGFVLFSKYLYHFVIVGFVLLLAMIAAIILTLQKSFVNKTQNVYLQLMKDHNNALRFNKIDV